MRILKNYKKEKFTKRQRDRLLAILQFEYDISKYYNINQTKNKS